MAVVWVETTTVFTLKLAESFPAGTVTVAGSVESDVLLASFTASPPEGASPLRVTVPMEDAPPTTLVGLRLTDSRVEGVTVS